MAMPEAHMGLQRVVDEGTDKNKLLELKRNDNQRYHQPGERLPKMDPRDPTSSTVAISRGALWQPNWWNRRRQKLGVSSDSGRR